MDSKYISGGTLQTCPFSKEPEIITISDYGKIVDRSQCPNNSECTEDTCPLCEYLKNQ